MIAGSLVQDNLNIVNENTYQLTFDASNLTTLTDPGTVTVRQGTQVISTFTTSQPGSKSLSFIADGSGTDIIFTPNGLVDTGTIDNVSLRRVIQPAVDDNIPIKEFLTGETDEGRVIHFRADTQQLQLVNEFENFVNPVAIITKIQRGTMIKCFVALDDDDFYELEGAAVKGMSTVKVHSKSRNEREVPPVTREIRISWRDSSKQLCRLTQGAIIFLPTNTNLNE